MKNRKTLVAVLGILGILFATVGVTYAFFSYSRTGTKENKISSGRITFLYKEESQGITLNDAMPMTDAEGKGQSRYFDFRVTSSVGGGMDIPYTVTAKLDENSTLPSQYVKVYLTDQSNNQIEPVRVYNQLATYDNNKVGISDEKILYEGIVPRNSNSYNKLFRLRMWMSTDIDMSPVDVTHYLCDNVEVTQEEYNNCNEEDRSTTTTQAYLYNENTFKIKVNVYSEGDARSDSEAATRASAALEAFTVDSKNVTKVDNTHYRSTITVVGDDSATVPIVVDTVNDNAQVTIEKVDSIGQVIKDNGIKKLSVTQNVTVTPGTNYFRITVRPEDKSEPTIYYLTITVTNEYSITYNLNGGAIVFESKVVPDTYVKKYTSILTYYDLPSAIRGGYSFEGWYDNSELTGDPVTRLPKGTTGNKEYWAKWEEYRFNSDDWATIAYNVQNNNDSLYNVGDTKVITLKNNMGTHTLRIVNKTSCKDASATALQQNNTLTSETACGFVIEFADVIDYRRINSSSNNNGGYPGSNIMYDHINNDVYNYLPDEIKNIIIDTTVVSSHGKSQLNNFVTENQKLYLMSVPEIMLTNLYDSALNTTRVLDYYNNNDNSIRKKLDNDNNYTSWWTRTAYNSVDTHYITVTDLGALATGAADSSRGVSPAFRIGPLSEDVAE